MHAWVEGGHAPPAGEHAQGDDGIGRLEDARRVAGEQCRPAEGAGIARHEGETVPDAELDRRRRTVTLPGALARKREADLGHGCQVAGPDPAELVHDRRRAGVQGGEDRVHDRRIDAGTSDEELIRAHEQEGTHVGLSQHRPDPGRMAPQQRKRVTPGVVGRHRFEQLGSDAGRPSVDVRTASDDSPRSAPGGFDAFTARSRDDHLRAQAGDRVTPRRQTGCARRSRLVALVAPVRRSVTRREWADRLPSRRESRRRHRWHGADRDGEGSPRPGSTHSPPSRAR